MKKLLLLVVVALFCQHAISQDEVLRLYVAQKKWDAAKTEVDKLLANPKIKDKDKETALLWKMTVYSSLYADSSLRPKYPDADVQALDAFNQYRAMDTSLQMLKEQNFAIGIGNLYTTSFDLGKAAFQAKDWKTSFKYFSQAERMSDILLANKLSATNATVDTVTVLYTGYAAQNSQLPDSAAVYYSRLADLKIAGPDYEDIYKFLVQYYSDKKDNANLTKYLNIAKQLYPNDAAVWTQSEMTAMTATTSLPDLLKKYQADYAAGGMTESKYIGYAEALATNDQSQLANLDSTQQVNLKLAAAQAFSKAFELSDTNGIYAFNAGVEYYAMFSTLDDRYSANRGEGAALKAKRTAIAVEEAQYADSASEWLEKAYTLLKAKQDRSRTESTSLNRLVDYLANIYMWKRDQTKVNGKSTDYDKYDALFKKYDAEHNLYH